MSLIVSLQSCGVQKGKCNRSTFCTSDFLCTGDLFLKFLVVGLSTVSIAYLHQAKK